MRRGIFASPHLPVSRRVADIYSGVGLEGGSIRRNPVTVSALCALALLFVQFATIRLSPGGLPVRIIVPLTTASVPLAMWPLRRFAGTWVLFIGLAANLAPICANGGLMPIERSSAEAALGPERAAEYVTDAWIAHSKDVLVPDGGGHLTVLGDSIVVGGGGRGLVASPGDVVIFVGLLVIAVEGSLAWQRRLRRESALDAPAEGHGEAWGGAATQR